MYEYWEPQSLLAVASALLVISGIAVLLRYYARRVQKVSYRADDYLALLSWVFYLFMCIDAIYGVKHNGYGTAPADGDAPTTDSDIGPPWLIIELLEALAFGSLKAAALLFYQRIFCVAGRRRDPFGMIITVLLVVLAVWTLFFLIFSCVQCGRDLPGLWHTKERYLAHCAHLALPYPIIFSISDFVLDLIILSLPAPKMTLKKKIAIIFLFLTAGVGLAASIARVVFVIRITEDVAEKDARIIDSQLIFWALLEAGISITAVNLPTVWNLFSQWSDTSVHQGFHRVFSLFSKSRSSNNKSSSKPYLDADHRAGSDGSEQQQQQQQAAYARDQAEQPRVSGVSTKAGSARYEI